jgi:hypothetical protein
MPQEKIIMVGVNVDEGREKNFKISMKTLLSSKRNSSDIQVLSAKFQASFRLLVSPFSQRLISRPVLITV